MTQLTGSLKRPQSVSMSSVSPDALISSTGNNISNLDYVGVDTSTVDITVDNEGRTISAKITPAVMNSIQVKEDQLRTLTAQVNALSTDIVSSLETMDTLAEELSVEVAKQKQLSESTANKQNILQNNYTQTISQMKSQYATDVNRLEKMIEELKTSMPSVKTDLQTLLDDITSDITKLEAEVQSLVAYNEHYKSSVNKKVEALENVDSSLQTQLAVIRTEVQNVKDQQASTEENFTQEIVALVDNYNALVDDFDTRCTELNIKLNNLSFVYQQNCQQFDNSINSIYSTLEYIQINHTTDINTLRTTIKTLSSNVSKIETALTNNDALISAQIVDIKRTLVNMYDYYYVIALKHAEDIEKLKTNDISLQNQVLDLETRYESIQNTLGLLSDDYSQFKEENAANYDELSNTMEVELQKLTSSLIDVNSVHTSNYDKVSADLLAFKNRFEEVDFIDAGDAYRFIGTI